MIYRKLFNQRLFFITLAFLICGVLVVATSVEAADLLIVCDPQAEDACKISSVEGEGTTLFNVSNLAPGESVNQKLYVRNESANDRCDLAMRMDKTSEGSLLDKASEFFDPQAKLQDVLEAKITRGGDTYVEQTFAQLFGQEDAVSLGTIPAASANAAALETYEWSAVFPRDAGNSYQGGEFGFSFDLAFECGGKVLGLQTEEGGQDMTLGTATKLPKTGVAVGEVLKLVVGLGVFLMISARLSWRILR